MKKKLTYDDYVKAHQMIDEFCGGFNKFYRKPGIKYIKCEHLKNGNQTHEVGLLWIGDYTRVVQCPICLNVDLGGFMRLLNNNIPSLTVDGIDKSDKEPISENWKQKFVNFFRNLRRTS